MEVILVFTPQSGAAAEFTVGTVEKDKTYRDFLSEFSASIDGAPTSFTVTFFRGESNEAALIYSHDSDSWRIASGDLDEFMNRTLDDASDYKVLVGIADAERHFTSDAVTVTNPEAAGSYSVVAGNLGCTLTVLYPHEPEHEAGDINGDDKINNKDVTRLLQYLAGWKVKVYAKALDVNGDGKINNKDATRLLQYLAGWNVKIYPEPAEDPET